MKDPYLYDDVDVLINLQGIKDQSRLDDFETTMARLAMVDLSRSKVLMTDVTSIFAIHKKLFERVYAWAGEKRTIDICKNEMILDGISVEYSTYTEIDSDLLKIQNKMDRDDWDNQDKDETISKIAGYISDVWKVHAFREGNTRTIAVYLLMLLKSHRLELDTDFIGKHSKYFRNALVMASLGVYRENQYLEKIIRDSIIEIDSSKILDDFNTINGYDLSKYQYNYHYRK